MDVWKREDEEQMKRLRLARANRGCETKIERVIDSTIPFFFTKTYFDEIIFARDAIEVTEITVSVFSALQKL